jgi:hypothetical protein
VAQPLVIALAFWFVGHRVVPVGGAAHRPDVAGVSQQRGNVVCSRRITSCMYDGFPVAPLAVDANKQRQVLPQCLECAWYALHGGDILGRGC